MTPATDDAPITLLRQNLVDVLSTVGPDLPTLCEGWTTAHLVAHLLLRETRPDLAAGIVVKPLASRLDRRTEDLARALADGQEYTQALGRFAEASPLHRRAGRVDESMNYMEYVVHREDVVRADPRAAEMCSGLLTSSAEEPRQIWEKLSKAAPLLSRQYTGGLVLVGTDEDGTTVFGPRRVRKPSRKPSRGQVTLTGTPTDLLLYLYGREDAARVTVEAAAQA